MRKLMVLLALFSVSIVAFCSSKGKVIVVKAGDADSFLAAIEEANQQNADSASARLYILIPDGVYDLGQKTLTTITGHNVSLIGQSMLGTIIRNEPPVEQEGIGKTGTIRNMSTGLYVQDITLKNALAYYKAGAAGRAVCLHDKGTRTICNRVRMLSYQDTYYTDNELGQSYLCQSEIHGTVDFICGAGDAYFDRCSIVTERRTPSGKGRVVIAAPRTSKTDWGYVFNGCVIYSRLSEFQFGRGWHTHPRCVWMNTTLMQPELLKAPRYDAAGMRTVNSDFYEYHTTDAQGRDITPESNVVTFTLKDEKNPVETILTPEQAKAYQLKNVFPKWRPEKLMDKLSRQAEKLKRQYL